MIQWPSLLPYCNSDSQPQDCRAEEGWLNCKIHSQLLHWEDSIDSESPTTTTIVLRWQLMRPCRMLVAQTSPHLKGQWTVSTNPTLRTFFTRSCQKGCFSVCPEGTVAVKSEGSEALGPYLSKPVHAGEEHRLFHRLGWMSEFSLVHNNYTALPHSDKTFEDNLWTYEICVAFYK